MTIAEWLKLARESVSTLDAELILMETLKDGRDTGGLAGYGRIFRDRKADLDRSYLIAHGDEQLTAEQVEHLDAMLARREQGEPLAYIIGKKEFYGRDFYVDPDVLIPRPETENVVELALEALDDAEMGGKIGVRSGQGLGGKCLKTPKNARILEIGAGSGCISLTLALEKTGAEVLAVDVSERALDVARRNYARYQAEIEQKGAKVQFLQSDLLAGFWENSGIENGKLGTERLGKSGDRGEHGAIFDVLVANLPYVDEKWEWLERKSLDFEPGLALYAGENGLELYRKMLEQIREINQKLVERAVKGGFGAFGAFGDFGDFGDFGAENNHERVVLARRMVLEADPCQHGALIELAVQNGYKWLKTSGFALLFEKS